MISALSWIPRGVAKLKLEHIADDDEHALQAMKLYGSADADTGGDGHSDHSEDSDDMMSTSDDDIDTKDGNGSNHPGDDVARAKRFAALLKSDAGKTSGDTQGGKGAQQISDSLAELNMDAYDDEDDADEEMNRILGGGNPGMAFYADPSDDPYLSKDGQSDSEDEIEYRETDLLIAAARNEEDISHLEIWVYEEGNEQSPDGNIYIHHSLLLPAFPLCLAWGPCDPGSGTIGGNFMAVGSFEPGIEIWNLDVVDAVEPVVTLGGADYEAARQMLANSDAANAASKKGKKEKKGGKKGGKKGKKGGDAPPEVPVRPGSHGDAVLGLAWNQEYCNVLASGSADHTVKIWDVATQQATQTLTLHGDKVQAVKWRPVEASLLLSGGYDRRLFLSDLRAPDAGASSWTIDGDVESVAWNPHDPHTFAVSSEDGRVTLFDTRNKEALYSFQAHKKAVTSVSFCPCLEGVMVTGSTDGRAKVWKRADGGEGFAEMACEKMGVGAIFSAEYCRDAPMLVAVGGAEGTCSVWDTRVAMA
jgi:periodic tryptophan protein 1